jgi:DNA-binding transcriptional LysR family regulator
MYSDVELRHLRYFVAVAEELHFGRAAERLHLAQPPLSQQIRKLEGILGYPLFDRTSRSVSLTAAGQVFLERAQRTLRNVQRDIEETQSIGRGEVGSLHIGFVGSAMLTVLPAIFRHYREAYPSVRLHLHESFTAKVIEGLQNGTLDAGLLRDGDPVEGLVATTLYSEPFVAVLPARHPGAKQKSISAAALRDEPFVYYPRSAGSRAYDKPLTLCEEQGFRPQIVQEAHNWLTILRLIGAGLGVTIAPACVRLIASPEVVCLPILEGRPGAGKRGAGKPGTSQTGSRLLSTIELACFTSESRPIVQRFAQIAVATAHAAAASD